MGEDKAEAMQWYRKATAQGFAEGQYTLGCCYANVTEDMTEAMKWCRKAVKQGDENTQFRLTVSYCNGDGEVEHKAEAVGWYRQTA